MTDFNAETITQILPHRAPFLFVDRILSFDPEDGITAGCFLSTDADFFKGHFPGRPIMPGVLVIEALAQACGLLIGLQYVNERERRGKGYYLARSEIKFVQPAYPGDTLCLEAKLTKAFGSMFRFDVAASVEGRKVASGALSLARQPD